MIIGIDISKLSFDAAWLMDQKESHQVFQYTDEGIEALLQHTPETTHYVMEATGVYHPERSRGIFFTSLDSSTRFTRSE